MRTQVDRVEAELPRRARAPAVHDALQSSTTRVTGTCIDHLERMVVRDFGGLEAIDPRAVTDLTALVLAPAPRRAADLACARMADEAPGDELFEGMPT